ncbi:TetR/AcrR family transcriptional regulator [Nocardia sp. NPDC020380]|uniref:TetR/AcrR family transcriptional regulator n=1 Tax=Nocardia sp. NPDC020380 TaxID=3364309 RepID=UPI003794552F
MKVTQTRKERERSERQQRIIDTAREIAETDGWDAVTVRKLAERIEYSQPVLYSHFAGKDAIVSAVAEQGCAELAAALGDLVDTAGTPEAALAVVVDAYLAFARDSAALYDAIFVLPTELRFGPDAPQALKDAFAVLARAFAPFAPPDDAETFTEVAWSTLHGLATLDRGGRLRPDFRAQRADILVRGWTARAGR